MLHAGKTSNSLPEDSVHQRCLSVPLPEWYANWRGCSSGLFVLTEHCIAVFFLAFVARWGAKPLPSLLLAGPWWFFSAFSHQHYAHESAPVLINPALWMTLCQIVVWSCTAALSSTCLLPVCPTLPAPDLSLSLFPRKILPAFYPWFKIACPCFTCALESSFYLQYIPHLDPFREAWHGNNMDRVHCSFMNHFMKFELCFCLALGLVPIHHRRSSQRKTTWLLASWGHSNSSTMFRWWLRKERSKCLLGKFSVFCDVKQ